MRQLEEENLRLKKLVADLSFDKAILRDMLAKRTDTGASARRVRNLQARYGASERQVCFALRVSRSSFHYRSVAADDCALRLSIRRSPKPGFTMATAGFTSCSGGRAGEIITNAFTDSTASRGCPCVSNAHAGIIRHSADSPSFRTVSESCLGHGLCSDTLFDRPQLRLLTSTHANVRDLRGLESALNEGRRDAEHHCTQTSLTTVAENR